MRRRSASGVMSTSSTWAAARTTSSGIVSRWTIPVMRSTTSLMDSRCWMLTVEMTSMPAASSSSTSCQRLAFREPGDVGVRQLVHEGNLRMAGEHCVEVHLLEGRSAVLLGAAGDDLEVPDLLGGARPSMGLHVPDDDVGAAVAAAPALVEHGEGLADTWGGAQVHAQRSPSHVPSLPLSRRRSVPCSARARSRRPRRGTRAARCRCASR